MNMRIRTKMVATEASYAPVSLLCEPWNQPREPRPVKAPTIYADRTEPEVKILTSMRAGNRTFDTITQNAFGSRNGRIDKLARDTLRDLLAKGVINRVKALDINGQPYIWSIK